MPARAPANSARRFSPAERSANNFWGSNWVRERTFSMLFDNTQPLSISSKCCSWSRLSVSWAPSPVSMVLQIRLCSASARPVLPRSRAIVSNMVPSDPVFTSCSSAATPMPCRRQTSPLSGSICPLRSFSRVDLPTPLRPTRQMRSPFRTWKVMLTNSWGSPNPQHTSRIPIMGIRVSPRPGHTPGQPCWLRGWSP